jgi:Zn-dependent alcohol dehydrogenase
MRCRYTVMPECAVAKITKDAPLEKVAAAAAAAAAM